MQGAVDFYLSARDTFLHTLQMMAAAQEGKLTTTHWPSDIFLTTEPGAPGMTLRFGSAPSQRELSEWAANAIISTFGVLAMAASAALDEARADYGSRYRDQAAEHRSLRCMWYMIRCAFAHPSAGTPTWECHNSYLGVFALTDSFTLDGKQLHGQPFSIDQFGGWHQVYVLLRATNTALGLAK